MKNSQNQPWKPDEDEKRKMKEMKNWGKNMKYSTQYQKQDCN
jgi:hypothetical protein